MQNLSHFSEDRPASRRGMRPFFARAGVAVLPVALTVRVRLLERADQSPDVAAGSSVVPPAAPPPMPAHLH